MLQPDPSTLSFHVVGGQAIADILRDSLRDCIEDVEKIYLEHENGRTNNPDSYFLRFPKTPRNRIIALPATIEGDGGLSGIKWISSFPGNLERGMQRASAVLVLNDAETGYPFALLEASRISAARTAASAVLGAYWLNGRNRHATHMSFVGGGIIARAILDMFVTDEWTAERMGICDLDAATTNAFIHRALTDHDLPFSQETLQTALEADVVVLVTTVSVPYITDHEFSPGQTILNISLRDIAPEIIVRSNNIVDDVEHCLKADTAPDLAARKYGNRDFINGTLAQLIAGKIEIDPSKPTIFSPFGLGVLDLALGRRIYDEARRRGTAQKIDNFLYDMGR